MVQNGLQRFVRIVCDEPFTRVDRQHDAQTTSGLRMLVKTVLKPGVAISKDGNTIELIAGVASEIGKGIFSKLAGAISSKSLQNSLG